MMLIACLRDLEYYIIAWREAQGGGDGDNTIGAEISSEIE